MGAVLAAVSPAVVVPRMVMLIEKRYGTDKAIPQMILSGASCDDIFVIVLFTTFLNVAQGGKANVMDFVNISVSIILGIILGIVTGLGLYLFFETSYARKHTVRNSMKVIIVLGFSFLLIAIGSKEKCLFQDFLLLSQWHVRLSLNVFLTYQPVYPRNSASCGSLLK